MPRLARTCSQNWHLCTTPDPSPSLRPSTIWLVSRRGPANQNGHCVWREELTRPVRPQAWQPTP